jgi:hypothetical protein
MPFAVVCMFVIYYIFCKTQHAKAFNARRIHQFIISLKKGTKPTNRTSQANHTQYYSIELHTFIHRQAQVSPEAGAT